MYQNLGPCHGNLSEYDLAIAYSEKALDIQRRYFGEMSEQVAISMNNLGAEYARVGQYEKALALHQASLDIRKKIWGEESPEVAKALSNLAIVYSYLGDNAKAISINREVFAMRQKVLDGHDRVLIQSLGNLGAELLLADSLEAAKVVLREAIRRYHESQNSDQQFYHVYLHFARSWALTGQLDSSLTYIQLALELEIPGMKGKGKLEPVPENRLDQSAAVLNILEQKGQNLFTAGVSEAHFVAANTAFAQAAESLDRLRMRFGKQSKITLGTEATPLFESWIANNYKLFELTGDPRYVEMAWQAASRSKAFLLREQLYKQRNSSYAGIPDSLIQQEQNLQASITALLSLLQEHAQSESESDSLRIQTWKTSLLDLESKQVQLIARFKSEHPHYYREKFSLDIPDLDRLRQKLKKDDAKLLQYFRATGSIFFA
ncbi:MAG: tetratricopeptide repeat protein [Bacteroidia bacterium]